MSTRNQPDPQVENLRPGDLHYRSYIGPPEKYDIMGALQFNVLTSLGLREEHFLLDIGCGSLRGGRLLIPYLLPGRYFGIEPEQWLIEEGISRELGQDLVDLKRPTFSNDDAFNLSAQFDQTFDFMIAQSIFTHTSEVQIRKCLSEARKVMNPEAIFVATYIQGDKNYTGNDWVYPGVVTYTLEHMQALAREYGLVCAPSDIPHPNNHTWITFARPENKSISLSLNSQQKLQLLERELITCQASLDKLRGNFYVKFGLMAHRLLQRIVR